MGKRNDALRKAAIERNDEYYTPQMEVEKLINNIKDDLKGKRVYLPCDDYRWSQFYLTLKREFNNIGLQSITATNKDIGQGAFNAFYDVNGLVVEQLQGDGDYMSSESLKIKEQSDIVITNPPFSIIKDFYSWVRDKDFVFLAPTTALQHVYQDIVDGKAHKMNFNCNHIMNSDGTFNDKIHALIWLTSLEGYESDMKYRPNPEVKYDTLIHHTCKSGSINVRKSSKIPSDYYGTMAVPLTYLSHINREEFEHIGLEDPITLDGKNYFKSVIIRRKLKS